MLIDWGDWATNIKTFHKNSILERKMSMWGGVLFNWIAVKDFMILLTLKKLLYAFNSETRKINSQEKTIFQYSEGNMGSGRVLSHSQQKGVLCLLGISRIESPLKHLLLSRIFISNTVTFFHFLLILFSLLYVYHSFAGPILEVLGERGCYSISCSMKKVRLLSASTRSPTEASPPTHFASSDADAAKTNIEQKQQKDSSFFVNRHHSTGLFFWPTVVW